MSNQFLTNYTEITQLRALSKKTEHSDIRRITPSQIPNYEFYPANEEILKKITEVYDNG